MNLWTIFLTGLFTGGLTCMAVQGGLLAATIAQRSNFISDSTDKNQNVLPIFLFLTAKLIAYTALGFLLGWFGSFFQLSLTLRIIMQIAVGIFMLGTALNLLEVHPFFRFFVIAPPKFLTRIIRRESKSKNFFAPFLLGAFTIFIPCGTTQAMMALSIASGSPVLGATILFVFIAGTSPIFFILGYLATKLGDIFHSRFLKAAALAIIILAIFNINAAVALSGSNFTLENIGNEIYCTAIAFCNKEHASGNSFPVLSEATIDISASGYSPNYLTVKAGSPVTLHLVNSSGRGCQQAFTIPSLGIQKVVPLGTSDTIKFDAPKDPTEITFMCSMNMFRGTIRVV